MSYTCFSILETQGDTPIIRLNQVVANSMAEVYGKYEAGNPSLSLKDRAVLAMLDDAEKKGVIQSETILVAATAGNTGVALAMACAVRDYRLQLFVPEESNLQKRKMLSGFGAQIRFIHSGGGILSAIVEAKKFVEATPKAHFLDQFNCPAAIRAHEETTAEEILANFPNGVDAFVMSVGTGATLIGVGRVLKKTFPQTKIIAVEPQNSAVLSGEQPGTSCIQQIGFGFIPENFDRRVVDRVVTVSDADAYMMTRRLAKKEGLLLGISSGANVSAALKIAQELGPGKTVLTVFCDQGQRYFSLEKSFTSLSEGKI